MALVLGHVEFVAALAEICLERSRSQAKDGAIEVSEVAQLFSKVNFDKLKVWKFKQNGKELWKPANFSTSFQRLDVSEFLEDLGGWKKVKLSQHPRAEAVKAVKDALEDGASTQPLAKGARRHSRGSPSKTEFPSPPISCKCRYCASPMPRESSLAYLKSFRTLGCDCSEPMPQDKQERLRKNLPLKAAVVFTAYRCTMADFFEIGNEWYKHNPGCPIYWVMGRTKWHSEPEEDGSKVPVYSLDITQHDYCRKSGHLATHVESDFLQQQIRRAHALFEQVLDDLAAEHEIAGLPASRHDMAQYIEPISISAGGPYLLEALTTWRPNGLKTTVGKLLMFVPAVLDKTDLFTWDPGCKILAVLVERDEDHPERKFLEAVNGLPAGVLTVKLFSHLEHSLKMAKKSTKETRKRKYTEITWNPAKMETKQPLASFSVAGDDFLREIVKFFCTAS